MKKTVGKVALLAVLCMAAGAAPAAERPLSRDDVMLLLIGGATTERMISLIEQRGVDFRMDPGLEKKFRDAGADDLVIKALVQAGAKLSAPASSPAPGGADNKPVGTDSATPAGSTSPAPGKTARASGPDWSNPSPERIQQIVQEFAAKEKLFKQARNNYTYHQINKVQELDADGNVVGVYQQEWDIVYDDSGRRIERVTYAPVDSLKRLQVTQEDLDSMRTIQPFVLTSDELPEYDIKYLGHVKVDEITAYVFSLRPKEIKKGRVYFQGTVWVDDRDLQIVKSEGKTVPELRTKKGENLFPRFGTYREQIDGKYWFPTYTMADDTLYFASGPVRVRQIIRYTDYRQFKAKTRIISATPTDEPGGRLPTGPKK